MYIKGKENKSADCLSRLIPIQSPYQSQISDSIITPEEETETSSRRIQEPSESDNEKDETDTSIVEEVDQEQLYADFVQWRLHPTQGKVETKPNAMGKLWKSVTKNDMPPYNEEDCLRKLGWFIDEISNKKLTLIRLIFGDPLFTRIEKEIIQEMMEFLSNLHPQLSFHLCFNNTRELNNEEKSKIIKESHANHLGEKNTIDKAKRIGQWLEMDEEIKRYVKPCTVCQIQKTTRMKNQAESIIPDIPLAPNDKIALDIFRPLPETTNGNKYILSLQDRLTRYTVLIPLVNEISNSIIEGLLDHYIYIFGVPNTTLTDQGSNFLSELMQQFE